jgi:type I restriction enzyme M protein
LAAAFKRLLNTIVVSDSRATRREDQLRELVHVLLVKLESDAKALAKPEAEVDFQLRGSEDNRVDATAFSVRLKFKDYFARQRTRVFHQDDREDILLTDESIYAIVAELYGFRILGDDIDLLAKAFQIFRAQALKSGEGQYLTPLRVVRPCVMAMQITPEDKVIDPACGTGSFIVEALRQVRADHFPAEADTWHIVKWANDNLYGADKDPLGVKLTRAVMIAMRDGSTHTLLGDSLRISQWRENYPRLADELGEPGQTEVARQFTVVITNPPFGKDLKISGADAKAAGFTITSAAAGGKKDHVSLEIGLVFLEMAHRLLQVGGRVGIILPETYFFSYRYRWLPGWLEGRLALRGMLNIPMEAFEEFCRAKTNFYIFEKVGEGTETPQSTETPQGTETAAALLDNEGTTNEPAEVTDAPEA